MKGFIALVLSRIETIKKLNLSKPIHLAFSYDEEIGCVGVHSLLDEIEKKSLKPELCIPYSYANTVSQSTSWSPAGADRAQ